MGSGGLLEGAPVQAPQGHGCSGGPAPRKHAASSRGAPGWPGVTYLRAGRGHQVDPRRGRQRPRGRAQGGGDDSVWRAQGIEGGPHCAQRPRGAHRGVRVAGVRVHRLPRGQGCGRAHGRGTGVAGGACGEKSIVRGWEHRGHPQPCALSPPFLPATPVNPRSSPPPRPELGGQRPAGGRGGRLLQGARAGGVAAPCAPPATRRLEPALDCVGSTARTTGAPPTSPRAWAAVAWASPTGNTVSTHPRGGGVASRCTGCRVRCLEVMLP